MLGKALQGAAKGVAVDADFENVTLLLHGNGTNGAQNNTFIDGSSNAFSITRNGNTTQGTFSPYGDNWSNYFDGTGDYLSIASTSALNLGTGDLTVEGWIYMNALPSANGAIASKFNATSPYTGWTLGINSSGYPYIWFGTSYLITSSTLATVGKWYHLALVRSGSTVTLYVDGTSVGTATSSTNVDNTGTFTSGIEAGNANGINGYTSNVRVVKGTAVYTANFTPPTAPLTAITNTSLLTSQSNRFVDNSASPLTITVNGNTSVQRFSPFSPTAAYASGTIGGSGYFDGTGDYLTIADNAAFDIGASEFSIEAFVYPNGSVNGAYIFGQVTYSTAAGSYVLWIDFSGYPTFYSTTGGGSGTRNDITSSTLLPLRSWSHICVCRSGTTLSFYLNGVRVATQTYSSTIFNSTNTLAIGADAVGSGPFNGYISSLRFLKGTSAYDASSSTLTVPTAPPTAITNTQLLTNYTNAGIIDNAMMNDLETVGNAQISTTQSKFGGSSMYFDGSGDYLVSNSATSDLYAFGTGDFTIEFWLYFAALPGSSDFAGLFDCRPYNTQGAYPDIYLDGATKKIRWYISSADRIVSGTALSATTWYHVAIARSGTSTKMFLNGTQEGSTYTDTNSYLCPANRPVIATLGYDPTLYNFNGYIDDLRITKGIARYTANFTAPTAPFADQ